MAEVYPPAADYSKESRRGSLLWHASVEGRFEIDGANASDGGVSDRRRRWGGPLIKVRARPTGKVQGLYSKGVLREPRTIAGLYVAVGASDAVGVGARRPRREAWPRLLHRQAFGPDTRFVNLGVSGATVASALRGQVPRAERLAPDVVTVWLVVNDIVAAVPVETYEAQLDELVGRLRRAGADRILVGNSPYLDRLPAYLAGLALGLLPGPDEANRIVDAYNAAIERVVARHDATLVDLCTAGLAARRSGLEPSLFARDGFHPSTAGHRALAGVFAAALTT